MTRTARIPGAWLSGALASVVFIVLSLGALDSAARAQSEQAPERRLSREKVTAEMERAQANSALPEDVRDQAVEVYQQAIAALDAAAASEQRRRQSEKELESIDGMVEELRRELSRPSSKPTTGLPRNPTTEQVEDALREARATLAASRDALGDIEELAAERSALREDASRRLGLLDQDIKVIEDELRSAAEAQAHPVLMDALRTSLLARREAALREKDYLRANLDLLEARAALIPWQRDAAERKVEYYDQLVDILDTLAQQRRYDEAREALRSVRQQCEDVAKRLPELAGVTSQTLEFAELLSGPDGVIHKTDRVARNLTNTRKYMAELDRIVELTRRRYEAVGNHGSATQWWPHVPENFPTLADVRAAIAANELELPEVQQQLIVLEELRSQARALEMRAGEIVANANLDAQAKADLERRVGELLLTRRDLLDRLLQQYGRYSNQLTELDTVDKIFADRGERIVSFLYERLYWSRSVPPGVLPPLSDFSGAIFWLNSPENWQQSYGAVWEAIKENPARAIGLLLLFVLLIGIRRRVVQRLEVLAAKVAEPRTDSFLATAEAFVHTLVLAIPLPLFLWLLSVSMSRLSSSRFVQAEATALYYLSGITLLFELTRQMMRRSSLAEVHFGWNTQVTRRLSKGLLLPEIVFLPLIGTPLQLAAAGLQLSSPEQLQSYSNALGRAVFVVALTILGIMLTNLTRPRREHRKSATPSPFRRIFLTAYPVISLAIFLPALLALLGFYLTAFLLVYQFLRTLWLVLLLTVIAGMLKRWHSVSRRKARLRRQGVAESGGVVPDDSEETFSEAEVRVRDLFRFVIISLTAVGLFAIWSDALPALQALKRVQVWPKLQMIDSSGTESLSQGVVTVTEGAIRSTSMSNHSAAGSQPSASGANPADMITGNTGAPEQPPAGGPESSALTLWNILEALLALIVTIALVRNIPGLIELILLTRTHLDAGGRVAISTLVRYAIMIFGVSASFQLLGLSWNKIQWLAAALTFGLGFGLQEIVANFVSGLILLVERPIRVGDAVTVGNLQGRVSKIRIRATTITLWDRSEMVVPNKEFVTTKLINWTLSDSRRRLSIPIRVAYGSDVRKVRDILVKIASDHPDVYDDPPPTALLIEFGENAIEFELRFYVDFGRGLKAKDDLQFVIDREFREQSIDFALPLLNIRLPGNKAVPPLGSIPPPKPAGSD